MPRVTAIGDFNEDLLMEVEALPEPDSQVVALGSTSSGGGCAANFAAACSKLGADVSLFAAVGDDARGRWLLELAEGTGIDVSGVIVLEGAPTGITVSHAHEGMRTMTSHPGANALFDGGRFDAGKVKTNWVHMTSYFLLSGLRSSMPELAEKLSRRGVPVSFDPGWHHGEMTRDAIEGLESIISSSELFYPNLREARACLQAPGADANELAMLGVDMGAGTCCVTLGGGGCVVYDGDEITSVPAHDVRVVDSCGAGDVFAAGFTVAYLSGMETLECARYATVTAAISLRGAGWNSYPTSIEVEKIFG